MPMGKRMMKVVLGVVIAGLLLGYVFPVGLNAVNAPQEYSITQDESSEVVVQERLNSTVTASSAGTSATIELKDTQTGTTESQSINVGDTATYSTLEGGTVNVTVDAVNSGTPNTINATYEVEQGFAWDDSSQTIFQLLGLFLVIVPLVVLARQAMKA